MEIKLIRNFEEGKYCSVNKELLLQMVDDNGQKPIGQFGSKKIFIFNPVTNERFEVMPEVPKYDLAAIRFGVGEHDYIVFTSARIVCDEKVEIDYYWYFCENDSASVIYTQTVGLFQLGGQVRLKVFVLDENYCLFQTAFLSNKDPQYELVLHDVKNNKNLSIENPLLLSAGMDQIIALGGNQCAVKFGNAKIGLINVKQFVSDMVLGLKNIYIDILDEGTETVLLPNLRKCDANLLYSKMDTLNNSEEIIIYDYENKVKKVRFNSSVVSDSALNDTYMINGVPYILKITDKSTRLVNLNTQKTEIRLNADVRLRFVYGDLLVTQRHIRKMSFMRKENDYIEVFRFPDLHHAVFKTRGTYVDCVVHFDDLLIFTSRTGKEQKEPADDRGNEEG